MKNNIKGFSLIEILITISVILILISAIFIYNTIKFNKEVNDQIDDVFYSYSIFKDATNGFNNQTLLGEAGDVAFQSKYPKYETDNYNEMKNKFGHHYFKTSFGFNRLQTTIENSQYFGKLLYDINLNDEKNKEAVCQKLMKTFLKNSFVEKSQSFLQRETFEELSKRKNVNLECAVKGPIKISLAINA